MTLRFSSPASRRAAFTLAEMLVVIAIIAVLATLVTRAVAGAMWRAKQTTMKMELDQIASSLRTFKEKYGAYPPCNLAINSSDADIRKQARSQLKQFLIRAYPRYQGATALNIGGAANDNNLIGQQLNNWGVDTTGSNTNGYGNPAQAMVFWLQGLSPNPTDPFFADPTSISNRSPMFEFDRARLVPGTGTAASNYSATPDGYLPASSKAPYVYFDAGWYILVRSNPEIYKYEYTSTNVCFPYAESDDNHQGGLRTPANTVAANLTNIVWYGEDTFQIIAAGQDGQYIGENFGDGTSVQLSDFRLNAHAPKQDWLYCTDEDRDNITSFIDKSSLEDVKP